MNKTTSLEFAIYFAVLESAKNEGAPVEVAAPDRNAAQRELGTLVNAYDSEWVSEDSDSLACFGWFRGSKFRIVLS